MNEEPTKQVSTSDTNNKPGDQASSGTEGTRETSPAKVVPEGSKRVRRLIVPKNAHIPIKQCMVDIFRASKEQASNPAETPAESKSELAEKETKELDDRLGLEVKSTAWASEKSGRSLKENHTPVDLPAKSPLVSQKQYLSPDEQQPPKKRGPKKAESGLDNGKDEKKTSKTQGSEAQAPAPKTRKRGKGKPDEPSTGEPADEEGTPSERLRKHLKERKAARIAREAAEKAEAEAKEETSDKKGKRALEKTEPSESENKKPKKTTEKTKSHHEDETTKTKAPSKRKKDEAPETDEKSEDESTKKAKLRSRKCVAYAKAKRETPGSLEEKTKAAKKATRTHISYICIHLSIMHVFLVSPSPEAYAETT